MRRKLLACIERFCEMIKRLSNLGQSGPVVPELMRWSRPRHLAHPIPQRLNRNRFANPVGTPVSPAEEDLEHG